MSGWAVSQGTAHMCVPYLYLYLYKYYIKTEVERHSYEEGDAAMGVDISYLEVNTVAQN